MSIRLNPYALAIAMVAIATLATQWLFSALNTETYVLFNSVVAVIAWYGGKNAGLLAIALSAFAISVFSIDSPQVQIASDGGDSWHLVLEFTLISLLIVFLTAKLHAERQHVEQLGIRQMQEKESQLRMAVQAAHLGIWDWDMVSEAITLSVEHAVIFGLALDEFDGKYRTFESCIHPDDRAGLDRAVDLAIQRRMIYQHEYRVVWRDGSIHWVEGRGQAFYDATGRPIRMSGIVLDIDRRKEAELSLRRYERIFATTPDSIALVDPTYTYQMVNQAYLRRFQKRPGEIIGHSIAEIVGNQVFETECKPRLDRALAGERVQFYLWYDFPITKHRYLSITYTPYLETDRTISGVTVSIRDMTKLQQAETELQQREEHLRQILQQMPVMLDAFDADGNIICWNQECERITGFSAEEVIGNPTIMELFYPEAAYRQQMMAQWAERGNTYRNWEWDFTCKDGTIRTISWSNLSDRFPVPGWAAWGIGIDVTERNQNIDALTRLNADLESQLADCRARLAEQSQQHEPPE
ncbi:MAG: PAS domain S-box protein [Cyanosarcina radialis HA8281-LM2]|jgi:PAS domain S-box-containing protein|nr:PAS domain S-box protein [Cyanosarcina radialis HA8281-LM2]